MEKILQMIIEFDVAGLFFIENQYMIKNLSSCPLYKYDLEIIGMLYKFFARNMLKFKEF